MYDLLAGIPLAIAGSLYIYGVRWRAAFEPRSLVALLLAVALTGVLTWRACRRRVRVNGLEPSLFRTGSSLRRLAVCLLAGLPIGLATRFVGGGSTFLFGLAGELTAGFAAGLAVWLWASLKHQPTAISRPSQLVMQGRTYDLVLWLAFGVGLGTLLGLGIGLVPLAQFFGLQVNYSQRGIVVTGGSYTDVNLIFEGGTATFTAFRIALGIGMGFLLGGLLDADSPWFRYLVAVRLLARSGHFPSRPAQSLDWAYAAGLIRVSGTMVQFRHRDLQELLFRSPAGDASRRGRRGSCSGARATDPDPSASNSPCASAKRSS